MTAAILSMAAYRQRKRREAFEAALIRRLRDPMDLNEFTVIRAPLGMRMTPLMDMSDIILDEDFFR